MKRDKSSVPSIVADLARLGQLFEEHRPRLHGMLQRRIDPSIKGRLDADDILSETFLLAQKRWGNFKEQPDGKPYPWLYRLAMDCLIEAWRRETRECRDPRAEMPWPEQSSMLVGLRLVEGGTSPTQAAARAEMRRLIVKVMALLPNYRQVPVPKDFAAKGAWPGLRSLGMVVRHYQANGQEEVDVRYYISSLPVGVKQLARAVRGHWGIENSCHWILDMTFREDESRIREPHMRENFAWLNRFALSLLKQHPGKDSIAMKRRGCGWSENDLMEVFTGTTL